MVQKNRSLILLAMVIEVGTDNDVGVPVIIDISRGGEGNTERGYPLRSSYFS